jgi:predicted nuclease of restriction endonuclease-like (RecB) superfamily
MKKKAAAKKVKQTAKAESASSFSLHPSSLFSRVAAILDEARGNVVRAVNTQMVLAYWHIGREIVLELQGGEERAAYGKQVLRELSQRLTERYGRGFSVTNLKYFRNFFQVYSNRLPEIRHMGSGESAESPIRHIECGELEDGQIQHIGCGVLAEVIEQVDAERGFSSRLGWSHYRALMTVEHRMERLFYEIEADKAGWDVETLERQIHTFLFARLLKSRDKAGVLALATKGQEVIKPMDAIKSPYVLDFLDLPESEALHESKLEGAIISNLQAFLLELGKGFAFVARQKRIDFDGEFFYIDLVFYHVILKCYVLIDLKLGKLTHQDVGQMDSYVRMYDELCRVEGDNPTIGLILCADKSGAMAKYSVLKESQQLFASRYSLHLPTEEELSHEVARERRQAESSLRSTRSRPPVQNKKDTKE